MLRLLEGWSVILELHNHIKRTRLIVFGIYLYYN